MGYLSGQQIAGASVLRESGGNIAQILVREGYITPKQASEIFKHIAASTTGQSARLGGATPAPVDFPSQKITRAIDSQPEQTLVLDRKTTQAKEDTATDRTLVLDKKNTKAGEDEGKEAPANQQTVVLGEKQPSSPRLAGESLAPGQMWGDYEIAAELGRGGMGVVYKAVQKGTNRLVALKVMLSGSMASSAQSRRFLREAQATAKLDHPNIVAVFTMGEHEGYHYFTMPYVEGTTLDSVIQDEKVPLRTKLEALIKVARALQHAHDKKILHRDIKPSNILLDRGGEPYLSDFGLAKLLDSDSHLTQTGQALGTPFYMPPEQVQGNKSEIGPASDIYSLGVVLYQILTGKLPFTAELLTDLYRKIVEEDPVPPREHDPKVPLDLQAICLKAIEKKPRFRYSSAIALANDLTRFGKGKKVQAGRLEAGKILSRVHRHLWRSPRLMAGIALGSLLLLAFTLWPRPATDWRKPWKAAQTAFARGDYPKAIENLERVKGHPEEVDALLGKIYAALAQKAKTSLSEKRYEQALGYIACAVQPSAELLLLKSRILQARGQSEEMRMELARLNELKPTGEELGSMGDMALKSGYFQDAHRYFSAALQMQPGAGEMKKRLAQTLLYWGRYQRAKEYYWQLDVHDPEIALGRSIIYYEEGDYHKALDELGKIEDTALSPWLRAQLLFARARTHWKILEPELTCWKWSLTEHQGQKEIQPIEKGLAEVETHLLEVVRTLEDSGSIGYAELALLKNAKLYLSAIKLERLSSPLSELGELRPKFEDPSVAAGDQIFFTQVMIRFLLCNSKWTEADRMCGDAIGRFPWVADFYHTRSLALFYREKISESFIELEKTIALDKWNFMPLENVSMLIFPRLTHEEFDKFVMNLMNRFIFRYPPAVPALVYGKYLADLRGKFQENENLLAVPEEVRKDWESILNRALATDSAAVHQLLSGILATQHANAELQGKIRRLLQEKTGAGEKEKLRNLLTAMHNRKKMEAIDRLERLLIHYAVMKREEYELEVYRMGMEGETLLREILCDSEVEPLLRLLAARMAVAIKKQTAYRSIVQTAASGSYPANLLAACALLEAGFPAALPPISRDVYAASESKHGWFYRVLLALHLSPQDNLELAEALLQSDEELVALCAAYNLRRSATLPPSLAREAIEKRLVQLLKSDDPYIRAIACQVFWNFSEVGMESDQKREQYRESCWKKYHVLIAEALEDPALEVQFSAMRSIILDAFTMSGNVVRITIPEIANTPSKARVVKKLRWYYQNSSPLMKFWSAVLLSALDTKDEVSKIVKNSGNSFLIRLACATAFQISNRVTTGEAAIFMLELLQAPIRPGSDIIFKQLLLVTIGWNATTATVRQIAPLMVEQMRGLIEQSVSAPQAEIQRAAVTALLWGGTARNIKPLFPYLDSDDPHMKRAAAGTLMALIARHQPQQLAGLRQKLLSYPLPVRSAAAYGSYEIVFCEVPHNREKMSNTPFEKSYDMYLTNLRNLLGHSDPQALSSYATALDNSIALAPTSEYYYEAALVGYTRKEGEEALKKLESALMLCTEEHPDLSGKGIDVNRQKIRCLLLRGEVYQGLSEPMKAREAFETLCREYPFHPQANFYLGKILEEANEFAPAREYFWTSYLSDPGFSQALLALALSYARDGDRQNALDILKKYHEKFGLKRSDLADPAFASIHTVPWIESLPE